MGRFYKTTSVPSVDYTYKYPFAELLSAAKYKQGRQDKAVEQLQTAKDELFDIDYVPNSDDEVYLKQKQAEFDEYMKTASEQDLSGSTGRLTKEIGRIASDPRLADIQYNADFAVAGEKARQANILAGKNDPRTNRNFAEDVNNLGGTGRLSIGNIGTVTLNDPAEAYFDDVPDESATDLKFLQMVAAQGAANFAQDPRVVQAFFDQDGDINDPVALEKFAHDKLQNKAVEVWNLNRGTQAETLEEQQEKEAAAVAASRSYTHETIYEPLISGGETHVTVSPESLALVHGKPEKIDHNGADILITPMNLGQGSKVYIEPLLEANNLPYTLNGETYHEGDVGYDANKAKSQRLAGMELEDFYDDADVRTVMELLADKGNKTAAEKRLIARVKEEAKYLDSGIDPFENIEEGRKADFYETYIKETDLTDGHAKLIHNFTSSLGGHRIKTQIPDVNNTTMINGKLYTRAKVLFTDTEATAFFGGSSSWLKHSDWEDLFLEGDWNLRSLVTSTLGLVKSEGKSDGEELYSMQILVPNGSDRTAREDRDFKHSTTKQRDARNIDAVDKRQAELLKQAEYNAKMERMGVAIEHAAFKKANRLMPKGDNGEAVSNYHNSALLALKNLELDGNEKVIKNKLNITASSARTKNPQLVKSFSELTTAIEHFGRRADQIRKSDWPADVKQQALAQVHDNFSAAMEKQGLASFGSDAFAIDDFGLDLSKGDNTPIDGATYTAQMDKWGKANNLTKVDSSAYKTLNWDSNIATQGDIKSGKVSAPYVSNEGKAILTAVDSWAQANGVPSINVNSMGRPEALQKFLKNTGSPAAVSSKHRVGSAIDFNIKDPALIASIKAELEPKGYKVLSHGGHVHIEPA